MLITEKRLREVIRSLIFESESQEIAGSDFKIRAYEIVNLFTSLGDDAEPAIDYDEITWDSIEEMDEEIKELYEDYLEDKRFIKMNKKIKEIKMKEIIGEENLRGWEGDYIFIGVKEKNKDFLKGYYVNLSDLPNDYFENMSLEEEKND